MFFKHWFQLYYKLNFVFFEKYFPFFKKNSQRYIIFANDIEKIVLLKLKTVKTKKIIFTL